MTTQHDKAAQFVALHQHPGAFIIPNPWDIASARILRGIGFEALATSSAAAACAIGRKDGALSREEALEHARMIVGATDLPVSADLENGFGDSPENVAETVLRAAEAGLVGCTIEDSTRNPNHPLYDFNLAVERIAAGAEGVRKLDFPFLLTARAHNYLYDSPSFEDTIKRLLAYEKVGADVLFAPGLPDIGTVSDVCASLTKPFNFMVGIKGKSFSVQDLEAAGVKRISLATSLYRAAMTAFVDAATQAKQDGNFDFVDTVSSTQDLLRLMGN
jgi:2-methylisocitrate lyase-like PEP mutase family enzyme